MLLELPSSIVPSQEIVTFRNKRLTYSKLSENASRLANLLKSYGIKAGDRVGIISTNRPELVETFFATFKVGAIAVPINYRARQDEFEYMINDVNVNALLFEERYGSILQPIIERNDFAITICLNDTHQAGRNYYHLLDEVRAPLLDQVDINADDTALILFTSGTTSRPKGVMITHGQLTNYVMNHSGVADGTDKGTSLISIPSYHVAGVTSICNAIYSGRRLVLMPQFEAKEWLETMEREKVTHAFLVPTMLKQVLDHPNFDQTDLTALENLSYGAAPMPLPVIHEAIERFPNSTDFANAFGMTETTSTVTVLSPEDHRLEGTEEEIEQKLKRLTSVGKPLPNVEIMIVDEGGKKIEESGKVGVVYVRTDKQMKGYWEKDDETDETVVDGWIHTGDIGWLDEDGYLYLEGRDSDLIIRGGENISPTEIENILHAHPAVDSVAVIGVPSIEWGEEVMAVIIPKDKNNLPTLDELKDFCRDKLASFKHPTKIEFVESFPMTSTGKVIKNELKDLFITQ